MYVDVEMANELSFCNQIWICAQC